MVVKKDSSKKRKAGLKHGFRSGLEDRIANQLKENRINAEYEKEKLEYIKPETYHTYTPDFAAKKSKDKETMYIETKGRFVAEDRKKHLLVRECHPGIDIRFVFSNAAAKLRKGSKTTYADWCEKNGFLYADREIPDEWLKELKKEKP